MRSSYKNYDIIVIGAGLGGSIAGKIAAENGYDTCIIDKEEISKEGRYKACGGAMSWELIEEIDYPEEKIARVFESLKLYHIDGEVFTKEGKGAVVWRSTFDKFITDMAIESGALLKEKEQLINIEKIEDQYLITTKKDKYKAKYVIAADGAASTTLNKLKWPYFARNDMVLTITREMKTTKNHIDEHLGKDTLHLYFGKSFIPVGYSWLFPKEDVITVGWGKRIDLIKNSREEFNKFVSLPQVKDVLLNSKEIIFKPHLLPAGLRPKLYDNNVFAVGDAGGIVDPISGKGIPYAMMSGQLAVESIKKCENKDKIEKLGEQYERLLNRKFLKILKAKRELRDTIFENDENIKKFLSLWQTYRSSEIVMKKLM
ncbi:MAG: NAD(P)/FAD-dependent oxidoreductase [Promethearchaeota archaeon]